jgi:flagellar biogenesis protein FliO
LGTTTRVCELVVVGSLFLAGIARPAESADRTDQLLPPRTSERKATTDATAARTARSRSSTSSWWTTLGGLGAVLALVLLSAKLLKKSLPAAQKGLPPEVIKILGRKPLDYRHTLHLVRCGSKLLVLGSSQEGLTTLSEFTDPVEIDYLAGLCESREAPSLAQGFGQLFRKFENVAAADADHPSPAEPQPDQESDAAVLRLQQRLTQSARPIPRDLAASDAEEAG